MIQFIRIFVLTLYVLPSQASELIVWGVNNDRGLTAALRQFEIEHPGWTVVTSTGSGGGMDPQKLMCGIAGGSPPDMLQQDRFSVGEWAARDAFKPLDKLIIRSLEEEQIAIQFREAVTQEDLKTAQQKLNLIISYLSERGASLQLDLSRNLLKTLDSETRPEILTKTNTLVTLLQGIHPEKFFDACWQEACFAKDGENRSVYAIPNSTDNRALYYNEALLERAGLVDEHGIALPPKTWKELEEYSIRLTEYDSDGQMSRLGFAPNFGNSWLYIYGWLNEGKFMSDDGRICTLSEPRIAEALRYMVKIYDSLGGIEKVDAFQSAFQSGEFDPFFIGKVAMKIDGNWTLNNIADYAPNLRFGVAPPPAPEGKDPVTWSGGFSWAIPVGSENPEMAFELIRFLNSDRIWSLRHEISARYSHSRGRSYVPSMAPMPHINQSTFDKFFVENEELPDRIKNGYLTFSNLMQVSRFRPVTPVGQLLWDEHARAYEKAVRHTYSPKQALEKGRISVQRELDSIYGEKTYQTINWNYLLSIFPILLVLFFAAIYWFGGRKTLVQKILTHESLAALGFISPWLIGFLLLTAGPILVSIVYSFCRYDVLHPAEFVGLENYISLFSEDLLFWKSLANTAYMMLGVPLGMIAGLAIAMLLNTEIKGMRIYRTIFYLPAIVPVVASAILWIWVLNPEVGLINSFLRMIGIADPPNWLQSASWGLGSKSAIILMGLWSAGSGMIIWLAGLKGIPEHLYEAAEIDGAGAFTKFFNVTLPMLSPYIFFNLIMGIIGTMQVFTQAYIMTEGGPDDSTLFYAYYLFNNAFRYFKMGYASALAWILFLVILALTLLQLKLAPRWVHYEAN